MSKVLVLYYSSYGHTETMAIAIAEGAREAGARVDIKRVPDLVPDEVARKAHFKVDQPAPVAKIDDLVNYDAIVIGTGTRFGRLSSQMANFLDQAGPLWMRGHCMERSAALSRPLRHNTAARRLRYLRSSRISCTSVWWSLVSTMATPVK
jgi:NAD(P)H:quinone oxidoreductase type IV